MEIKDDRIDSGKAFDWGKTSREYAKYRNIYPEKFYQIIVDRGTLYKRAEGSGYRNRHRRASEEYV